MTVDITQMILSLPWIINYIKKQIRRINWSTYPYILIYYHNFTPRQCTICPRREDMIELVGAKCRNCFSIPLDIKDFMKTSLWLWRCFLYTRSLQFTEADMIDYMGQNLSCLQGTSNSCCSSFKGTQLSPKVKGERWINFLTMVVKRERF